MEGDLDDQVAFHIADPLVGYHEGVHDLRQVVRLKLNVYNRSDDLNDFSNSCFTH